MICPKCGNELTGGDFCGICGCAVAQGGAAGGPLQTEQPQTASQARLADFFQPTERTQPTAGQTTAVDLGKQSYPAASGGDGLTFTQRQDGRIPAPEGFTDLLQRYGRSKQYLAGIILFTVGSIISIFGNVSIISAYSALTTLLVTIGFWLLYAASGVPKLSGKAKTAMTFFKIGTIISIVALGLIVLALLVLAIIMIAAPSVLTGSRYVDRATNIVFIVIGITIITTFGLLAVFYLFYYKYVLKIISGIKRGIMDNVVKPLKGVVFLMVITFFGLGSAITSAFMMISMMITNRSNTFDMYDQLYNSLYHIPREYRLIEPFLRAVSRPSNSILLTAGTIAVQIGAILCIIVLNRFNGSLKRACSQRERGWMQ